MKIHYRKPNLVEQMNNAIAVSAGPNAKPIDHFELSQHEFQNIFTSLDKIKSSDTVAYSFKGIAIKVSNE
jgi:hypothetical protein